MPEELKAEHRSQSNLDVARELALVLNSKPSEEQLSDWLYCTPTYKRHRDWCRSYYLAMAVVALAMCWIASQSGELAAFMGLSLATFAIAAILAVVGVLAWGPTVPFPVLKYWTTPMSADKSLCERFVRRATGRPDLVLAVDRELAVVDWEFVSMSLEQEQVAAENAVCAQAHSLVKSA